MKVYIDEHKVDAKTLKLKRSGKKIVVEAELIEDRPHSIIVKLKDGTLIKRKKGRDIPEGSK